MLKANEKRDKRIFLAKNPKDLPPIDLTAIQKNSYQWFWQEGIQKALAEISPIEDFTAKNWRLELGNHYASKPKYSLQDAINKGLTYSCPLKVQAKLINLQTGESSSQDVFLGDIPAMTEVGTFVINGIERTVINQLVRSPGVYFSGEIDPVTGKTLFSAELRPIRGSWLEFNINRNDVITVRIDRRRKFPITTFLRAIGMPTDEEILNAFRDASENKSREFITTTLEKDTTKTKDEATVEIYKKMRPGEPAVLENAQEFLYNMFFNPRRYELGKVGRFKLNKKLSLNVENTPLNWVLTKEDVVSTIKYLISLQNGMGQVDDIDHLANRRLRCVGELVAANALRIGLLRLERTIKEKMSLSNPDIPLTPAQLVNARPIISSLNEFFRSSQLSSILDQTNPLSEVDNLRRISVMGTGGITRERASFSIRDINASQYGRICPVRSPEGPNIGLVTYLALYARVNEFGFLETPYRKVEKDEKTGKMRVARETAYLSADDEQEHYITHAGISIDNEGFITDERVAVRFHAEFLETQITQVEYIDIAPQQVFGIAASLIPFLSHDDGIRALMGTNMQCQAVPLLSPSAPVVGTGLEDSVAESMGRVIKAEEEGQIIFADGEKVVEKTQKGQKTYLVEKFKRTSSSTCYSQKPLVRAGDKVKKGDILIDGPATDNGELALGANLRIAYMPFLGLGYEDAIIVSDRLVKDDSLSSIHIEEYEAEVVDTKLGPEELTRDIPNVGEEDLANLDEGGIVVVGSVVGPNDILVGKIAPKGETELTAEERLLRAIFGEKAREVRDTSLRVPHGEKGTVISILILDREKGDELPPGTNKLIKVKVAQLRKVMAGDKVAGRHGNKGVISKIVPAGDMPYTKDGTPIDIIISPLSVLARMNLGQLLEAELGWAEEKRGKKVAIPVFTEISEDRMKEELKEAGLPLDGKTRLYDGRTGEPFENEIAVGIAYIMKLIHMVEDKTHARSTGPYSLVTQQPLGGKAQMGGQRLGEMEVWALEAHRAAFTLQEMLTIKSDDVIGRAKAFEAIVKGTDIPQSTIPESFKVLVKELNSLALEITPTGTVTTASKIQSTTDLKEEENIEKKAEELRAAAGEEIIVDKELVEEKSQFEIENQTKEEEN